MNENSLISQFGPTKLNSFKRRATELNLDSKQNGQKTMTTKTNERERRRWEKDTRVKWAHKTWDKAAKWKKWLFGHSLHNSIYLYFVSLFELTNINVGKNPINYKETCIKIGEVKRNWKMALGANITSPTEWYRIRNDQNHHKVMVTKKASVNEDEAEWSKRKSGVLFRHNYMWCARFKMCDWPAIPSQIFCVSCRENLEICFFVKFFLFPFLFSFFFFFK